MADEAVELLINVKNGKSVERPLSEDIIIARGNFVILEQEQAAAEVRREQALARLRDRALSDEVVADLLLVLGLLGVSRSVRNRQDRAH